MFGNKRTYTFPALALSLALLTGCAAPPAAAETPASTETPVPAAELAEESTPLPTAEPEPAEPEVSSLPVVRVESEQEDYYEDREDGALLLNYACACPQVTLPGREEAQQAINEALELYRLEYVNGPEEPQEGVTAGRENFLHSAREELEMRTQDGYGDSFMPYAYLRSADLRRGDETILSLTFDDTTYMGGAHGYTARSGMVFDTRTGERLELEDLGKDAEFLTALAELLRQVAESAEYGFYDYWEEYREILPGLLREGNWYLSREGLTVIANPYEMSYYAAGRIEFTIPYGWLTGYMKEDYLPADTAPEGTLSGEILSAPGESTYLLDDGTDGAGAAVRFTALGRVENVAIRHISYWEYSNTFSMEDLLWYAGELREGESVTVQTWIPDAAPSLAVSYTGEGGERCFYISQSGMDGSLVLMPEADFPSLPREISRELPFAYDLDGDGERESIDLRATGENGGTHWELLIDGTAAPSGALAMDATSLKLWLTDLDYDGVAELFFTGDMGSDDYVTCGWRGDTLDPIAFAGDTRYDRNGEETDTAEGELCFSIGCPILRSWIYQMGTYAAFRPYIWQDGRMVPLEGSQWSYRSNTFELETARELPVLWDDGEGVLPAGSRLTLVSSDGRNTRFVTPQGHSGTIALQYRREGMDSGWFIGQESESRYFTVLPYAG